MGMSGLIGAGAAEGLDDVILRMLSERKFQEQMRAQKTQESQNAQRIEQDSQAMAQDSQEMAQRASQHADNVDFRDRDRRDRSNRAGVEDMMHQRGAMDAADDRQAGDAALDDVGGDPLRRIVALSRAGVKGLSPDDLASPEQRATTAANAETAALDGYEKRKKIDLKYRAPTGGGGRPDQTFVTRGGQVVPIEKGTAQMGDTPYDPVSARTSAPVNRAEAEDTAREAVRLASELRKHPGLRGAFGVVNERFPTMKQDTRNAEILRESLTALLSLENMEKMKGVLSNNDMRVLKSASTTINGGMSPEAAAAELDRLVTGMSKTGGASPPGAPPPRLRFDAQGNPIKD